MPVDKFQSVINAVGASATKGFGYSANQLMGGMQGGGGGSPVINISEKAGALVDIHIAESATRGNRYIDNDTTE